MSGRLRSLIPGALAGGVLLAVIAAAAAGLLAGAGQVDLGAALASPYVQGIVRFSIWQAFLSAVLSVGIAIPVARALARRPRFAGRTLLVRLLGLPMVLPTIVAILGIIAVYGRNGLLNRGLAAFGLPAGFDLYGLQGILLAHLFLNMPFAARVLLQGWAAIPGESWRLAAQLGMSGGQIFRWIEWPMIRQVAPGIAGIIFLLCFSSFAVVLVLGGGPPNATLEVAIYQALKFEFDLPLTLALSIIQIVIAGGLAAGSLALTRRMPVGASLGRPAARADSAGGAARTIDAASILAAALILLLPLAAILHAGVTGPVAAALSDRQLWLATARSAGIGLSAGVLAVLMGSGFVHTARLLAIRYRHPRLGGSIEIASAAMLVMPPFVMGAGLFILAQRTADPARLGLPLVVLINALMGLPFVVRILTPPATEIEGRHGALIQSLGMTGWQRLRLVDWPLLRRPVGLALAVASTLAMGDFGVIALFGTQHTQTLSLLLYQLMGAYRVGEAAVAALLLVALCLIFFLVIERGVGGRDRD